MSDPRYDKHYLNLAHKVLKESRHIPDFGYHGSDPDDNPIILGDEWGFTISTYRDADLLTESNWEIISNDMLKRFPKSVIVDPCKHYAYGWVDHLTVRMIDSRNRLTMAGIAILDWQEKLDNYPIASEDDFSRREFEAYDSAMVESAHWIIKRDPDTRIIDNPPEGWIGLVIESWRESYHEEYDHAWDHEGWIDDHEGVASVHLVEIAQSLGFVEEWV